MVMMVNANLTALLEAINAGDETRMIHETLELLGPVKTPPAKIAARVGIPAAWGGGDGHALDVLSVAGRVAQWMRAIPIGPEPHAEQRRALAPALPLLQGFTAVADRVRIGLPEPHPTLPNPIIPAEVRHSGGVLGAMREAIATRNLDTVRALLMGYYATGADYREILTTIYAALDLHYPDSGHPLIFAVAGSRVLDMADWGDRVPAYIHWLAPLLLDTTATPAAQAARAYATDPAHSLAWLRTRLAIPNEAAAGPAYQRALLTGDAQSACDATLRALRDGATPIGIAAGAAIAAATLINATPQGDRPGLIRAAHTLLYAHSVHIVTLQTQTPDVWPLLYTLAAAVNSARPQSDPTTPESTPRSATSTPIGGLIPASMIRTLEQQLLDGDTTSAIAVARRYLQMGHPPRALAGVIGSVAATRDATGPNAADHILPLVAAAAEEYETVPRGLEEPGQNTLLTAAIRLASELGGNHTLADRVRAAIDGATHA